MAKLASTKITKIELTNAVDLPKKSARRLESSKLILTPQKSVSSEKNSQQNSAVKIPTSGIQTKKLSSNLADFTAQ